MNFYLYYDNFSGRRVYVNALSTHNALYLVEVATRVPAIESNLTKYLNPIYEIKTLLQTHAQNEFYCYITNMEYELCDTAEELIALIEGRVITGNVRQLKIGNI